MPHTRIFVSVNPVTTRSKLDRQLSSLEVSAIGTVGPLCVLYSWPASGHKDQVTSLQFKAKMAIEQIYVHGVIQFCINPEYNKEEMKRSVFIGEQKVSDVYSFN